MVNWLVVSKICGLALTIPGDDHRVYVRMYHSQHHREYYDKDIAGETNKFRGIIMIPFWYNQQYPTIIWKINNNDRDTTQRIGFGVYMGYNQQS